MHYMCILCTIHASKLGDRIMIGSFLAVISYWTTGHVFSMGWLCEQKSTITMLGAMCVLDSECVRCQETHQVKAAWKERKVYRIKIVRIFLGSYRIPNMALQISSVLGWHLMLTSHVNGIIWTLQSLTYARLVWNRHCLYMLNNIKNVNLLLTKCLARKEKKRFCSPFLWSNNASMNVLVVLGTVERLVMLICYDNYSFAIIGSVFWY